MIDGGLESLAVIADFDRTITSAFVGERRGASCYGPRACNIGVCSHASAVFITSCIFTGVADGALSLEIRKAKQKLFDYYYPIEKSADLTVSKPPYVCACPDSFTNSAEPNTQAEQKQPLMIEWYSKSNTALIDGKFRRSQLESAVTAARQGRGGSGNEGLALRNGYVEFQAACEAAQVPLLIFSAGIADVIQAIFSRKFCFALHLRESSNSLLRSCAAEFHVQLGPTTRLVSNWMVWNELETTDDAQLVGFTKPLIHMYNKNQSVVPQTERRRHVLLLGDGRHEARNFLSSVC
eukprot:SAG31_NODE_735_length_12488_cov_7.086044_12_plen_294_part_00